MTNTDTAKLASLQARLDNAMGPMVRAQLTAEINQIHQATAERNAKRTALQTRLDNARGPLVRAQLIKEINDL